MITLEPVVKYNIRDFKDRLEVKLVLFPILTAIPSILLYVYATQGQRSASHKVLSIQYNGDT